MPSLGRVLIVEDASQVAEMLQEVLTTLGYESVCAANGPQALRLTPGYQPDVILLDLSLPGMSGVEVLTALCATAPGIPIVMVTGNQDEATAIRTLALGAFDYVRKPFDVDVLERILAAAVGYRAP